MRYPGINRSPQISRPTFILSLGKGLKDEVMLGAVVLPGAAVIERADLDRGFFSADPSRPVGPCANHQLASR
jgi:hypothetical protein